MKDDSNDAHPYDDIINLPRHKSSSRPPMPRENRAAQFSPFAALTGFEEAVKETARLTDKRIELNESEKARLDEKLSMIQERLSSKPEITITYFKPDKKKAGGSYISTCGIVKRIDYYHPAVVMQDGKRIDIEEINDIQFR